MGKKGKIAPLMAFSSASASSASSSSSEEGLAVGEEGLAVGEEKETQNVSYVAVFTVCFDVDHGNTVSGVYPSVPPELLEGLEFRSLPAGAHKGNVHHTQPMHQRSGRVCVERWRKREPEHLFVFTDSHMW